MSDKDGNGSGHDFSWVKKAVTPKPKIDLKKENPMLYFALQRSEQKEKEKNQKEKEKNDAIKKQAPKNLDTQVSLIHSYLMKLKQSLKKEGQQLSVLWSSVKTEHISNRRSNNFDQLAGWDQYVNGQHEFDGREYDPQDPPRAHGALYDTLYKTTICKTGSITLNNDKKWIITVYPSQFDEGFAVFTPAGFCSTLDEVQTKIREYIEKLLQEAAR